MEFFTIDGQTGNDDIEVKESLKFHSFSDNDYSIDNTMLTIQRVYDETPVEYILNKQ